MLLYYFGLCRASISRVMNAKEKKKTSKFEREHKSNGNPLLHHVFFTSFTRIFLLTLRTIPYNCLLCCVSISRVMNAKKTRNSSGKTRAMESHFYSMEFFFLSQEFSKIHSEKFLTISFLCCFRISRIMNAKKS